MTIESKIAANGRVMYFAVDENGKKSRVKATAAVVIECAIQTRDAYRAKVAAKLAEEINAIADYAVSVEAQDAATDAEIELANAGNDELDENNVDDADKITVESAQANGLSFEEFMAARAGLTLDEYLAKQAKEEEAIKAHQLNLKIKALKNSIATYEINIERNVGTINDIFNNHWKIGTDDDFEEYANELAAEIADNLNQIAKLNAKLADLVPNVEINPADYAVSAEAQDVATDAEITLANAGNDELDENNVDDIDNAVTENAKLANVETKIRSSFYKEDGNGNLSRISYEQAQAEAELALAKFCGFTPEEYAAFLAENNAEIESATADYQHQTC